MAESHTNVDVKRDPVTQAPSAQATAGQPGADRTPAPRERHPFTLLRQEIDRLFDDFTWPGFGLQRRMPSLEPMRDWMPAAFSGQPAMDLVEKEDRYELTADLPGIEPKQIELTLSEGVLSLKAEKTEEKSEEGKGNYRMRERSYGGIWRSIALPRGVDAAKVEAKFDKGVLKVTLPKSKEARENERRIEVKGA